MSFFYLQNVNGVFAVDFFEIWTRLQTLKQK